MLGPAVLGAGAGSLPFTGINVLPYALLALGLLVAGLLLARAGRPRARSEAVAAHRDRGFRVGLAVAIGAIGVLILVFDGWWRGVEAWAAAHSIQLVTSNATDAVTRTGFIVMQDSATSISAFVVTNECTMAQILGALLIGGAPLLLVHRLSMLRVSTALGAAVVVLLSVNIVRLTAIGVAVATGGDSGFVFAHTYLGSLLTFVGTCLAGVMFALVLIAKSRQIPLGARSGVACS